MRLALQESGKPFLRRRRAVVIDDSGVRRDAALVLDEDYVTSPQSADGAELLPNLLEAWCRRDRAGSDAPDWMRPSSKPGREPLPLSPPVGPRSKVLVVGSGRGALPERGAAIVAMLKYPTAMVGPDTEIVLPRPEGRFDVDAALGVVIGRRATRIAAGDALGYVAGYTLLADVTDRDVYEREARTNNGLLAKNLRGLSPLGPWIWLAAGGQYRAEWSVYLRVGGELRQQFSLTDFVWSVEEAVAAWSVATLNPGDVVALGAGIAARPSGTADPPVRIAQGDVVEITCEPLGRLAFSVKPADRSTEAVGP